MTTVAPVSDTFTITEEILVRATLDKTFASLIAQMGRLNETPERPPYQRKLTTRAVARRFERAVEELKESLGVETEE